MTEIIQIYADVVSVAVPFAIVFAIGNLIVSSFLRMAFGGKIEF